LLRRSEPLGRLRGRFHQFGNCQLMPTYHPAYLLRNPSGKRAVWEDVQRVMQFMGLESTVGGQRA
jgi:DNA polymerase